MSFSLNRYYNFHSRKLFYAVSDFCMRYDKFLDEPTYVAYMDYTMAYQRLKDVLEDCSQFLI